MEPRPAGLRPPGRCGRRGWGGVPASALAARPDSARPETWRRRQSAGIFPRVTQNPVTPWRPVFPMPFRPRRPAVALRGEGSGHTDDVTERHGLDRTWSLDTRAVLIRSRHVCFLRPLNSRLFFLPSAIVLMMPRGGAPAARSGPEASATCPASGLACVDGPVRHGCPVQRAPTPRPHIPSLHRGFCPRTQRRRLPVPGGVVAMVGATSNDQNKTHRKPGGGPEVAVVPLVQTRFRRKQAALGPGGGRPGASCP